MRKLFLFGLLAFIFSCSSEAIMGPPSSSSNNDDISSYEEWAGEIQVEDPASVFTTYIKTETTIATTTDNETVPVREFQLGKIEAQKGDLVLSVLDIKTITIELSDAYPDGSLEYTLPSVVDPTFISETLGTTGKIVKITVDVASIVNSGTIRFENFGSEILNLKIKTSAINKVPTLPDPPIQYSLVI